MKRIISLMLSLIIILSLVCGAVPAVSAASAMKTSDQGINLIKAFEGFQKYPQKDGTQWSIGYGSNIPESKVDQYNASGITEAQAVALMKEHLADHEKSVNTFIDTHKLTLNQQQFDALVSFSYNIGAGYWNSTKDCYVRTVMQNSFALTDASSDNPYSAKACKSIRVYAEHDASSDVIQSVSEGGTLRVIGYYRNDATAEAWYKVKVGDAIGWARSGNITLTDASGMTRDLAFVDGYTFGSNLLDWHKAGGNCYAGLYYRRLAEAKIFAFGDYEEASKSHANYKKNTYGFEVPDCI